MNFVSSYTIKRNNKNFVKVTLNCKNGNCYSTDVNSNGYDLRNKSEKYLLALDAVHNLQEKGYLIYLDCK